MSSRPDWIFELHQQWQSGYSRVYSNCCCCCWFEPEIINIGQSSPKMYSNNIVNFQEFMTIFNSITKKVWKLIESTTSISSDQLYTIERWSGGNSLEEDFLKISYCQSVGFPKIFEAFLIIIINKWLLFLQQWKYCSNCQMSFVLFCFVFIEISQKELSTKLSASFHFHPHEKERKYI